MDKTFVNIDLTEFEYDEILEWVGDQEISSGLSKLYDKLLAAAEAAAEEEEVESLIEDEE